MRQPEKSAPAFARRPTWIVLLPANALPEIQNFDLPLANQPTPEGALIRFIPTDHSSFRARAWGISEASLSQSVHLRDVCGYWHSGADALAELRALLKRCQLHAASDNSQKILSTKSERYESKCRNTEQLREPSRPKPRTDRRSNRIHWQRSG